jgi:hypothetical protein
MQLESPAAEGWEITASGMLSVSDEAALEASTVDRRAAKRRNPPTHQFLIFRATSRLRLR